MLILDDQIIKVWDGYSIDSNHKITSRNLFLSLHFTDQSFLDFNICSLSFECHHQARHRAKKEKKRKRRRREEGGHKGNDGREEKNIQFSSIKLQRSEPFLAFGAT